MNEQGEVLKEFKVLRDSDVLTKAEFDQKKKEIMGED
ncbi:SHOCT domain-containing protein [Lactiplantibacillus plajomi]